MKKRLASWMKVWHNTACKGNDGNKYRREEPTESSRRMRGAGRAVWEYLPELRTERRQVGCDGRISVIRIRVYWYSQRQGS